MINRYCVCVCDDKWSGKHCNYWYEDSSVGMIIDMRAPINMVIIRYIIFKLC